MMQPAPETENHPLHALFHPRAVAVIGATPKEGSIGRAIVRNLIGSPFGGTVYPVNPNYKNVLGIRAYPEISAVPEPVDLAVIAVRAPNVPAIVRKCVAAGVKGALILAAGFRETGEEGRRLERDILRDAHAGNMRILGPNSFGIMNPLSGLNATFAPAMVQPGSVGFISQSGALNMAVLDWSIRMKVGFSAFLCAGSMTDVGWGDLISYLGEDMHTRSIVVFMESLEDAQSFMCAARRVSQRKPIIVLKGGETAAAERAVTSHVGALAGSNQVFDAAFRRSGVLRVRDIESLFRMAEVLNLQPRPRGPRLSILTNAGGLGVLATDALLKAGAELAPIPEETDKALSTVLPPHWSHANPVNVFSDADLERYAKTIEIAANNPDTDGLLLVLTPQAMIDVPQTLARLTNLKLPHNKPILASLMGGVGYEESEKILKEAGIPSFPYPDTAARIFYYMWRYAYNLRGLYETPVPLRGVQAAKVDRDRAGRVIADARDAGRTVLSEYESKQLLTAYGISVVDTHLAHDEEEAVAAATRIGYPVVVKVHSHTIVHKATARAVRLHLQTETQVRQAYRAIARLVAAEDFAGVTVQPMATEYGLELILGSAVDPQFGPVLLFGAGGNLVEVLRDRAVGLPPLNTTLALRMIEQTRIFEAIQGGGSGYGVKPEDIQRMLVRLSQLVIDLPRVKEIDINPVLLSADGARALDALVILHDHDVPDAQLPRPVIRPYPDQYVSETTLRDGAAVTFRPIRAEDEPAMVDFHEHLSDDTVYYRYLVPMPLSRRVAHSRLAGTCFVDYHQEIGLLAVKDEGSPQAEILAVGRVSRLVGGSNGEFAIVVRDDYQGQGLGKTLLQRLIDIGRQEGYTQLRGTILPENRRMQELCRRLGFRIEQPSGDDVCAVFDYKPGEGG
ncbi:MAG: GNAT family N-acetyltransferase [Candidatus Hydrogenedentota bacterium]